MRDSLGRAALAPLLALLLTSAAAAEPVNQRLGEAERALARERAAHQEARRDARRSAEAERRAEAERAAALMAWRRAEGDAAESAERLAAAEAARLRAADQLAEETRVLAPLLPALQRLALFPAETLLVLPDPPAERLAALAALRSLTGRLAAGARARREAAAEARATRDRAAAQRQTLLAAMAVAGERAAQLDRAVAAARKGREEAEAEEAERARKVAAAAAAAASLQALVGRLDAPPRPRAPTPAERAPGAGVAHGGLVWPVRGRIVARDDGEAGAEGIGIAAAPSARVLAPCAGSVAYAGPFRSLGPLLILDCGGGYHVVLVGMERLDASVGQRVRGGDPVATMPAYDPRAGGRAVLSLELRRAGRVLDPGPYLSRQQDRIGG